MPEWFVEIQQAVLQFLEANQYLGLALYVAIEEAGVPFPIPADTAIVVMGYQVYRADANPWVVVAIVVVAATLGASVLYWIARLLGTRLLDRYGGFLRITPGRRQWAQYWFRRYQVPAVVIGRLIPGFRIVITIVAGAARGSFWLFVPSAALSALIWVLIYMSLGWALGDEYERVADAVLGDPRVFLGVVLGIIAMVVVFVLFRRRRRILRGLGVRRAAHSDDEGS